MNQQQFIERVQLNISRHGLLPDSKPVVIAVSGGADSMALLVALHTLGVECVAAHCNYHLRGEESNRDMRAVQALTRQLGVDLYVRDFDVEARQRHTGESVEMACRELRYEWFYDLLDRLRAQAIAVAHHSEDNIETFMLNLLRGSGISGLSAMRWRNGYVIRPLLDFSRDEIEQYLEQSGVEYVVDSTNREAIYARNKLRLEILPTLEEAFPGATQGILMSLRHLAENRDFYAAAVEEKKALYFKGLTLSLSQLIAEEPQHRMLLFEWLRPWGFNSTQVDNLLASASRSGIEFVATSVTGYGSAAIKRTVRLELNRGVATISDLDCPTPYSETETPVSLARDILTPVHILVSEHSVAEFKPERNPSVAYFDKQALVGNPRFALRRWERGDRMLPYGLAQDKLLSDLFTNAKYSAEQKRKTWLLTRDGEILWAVGLRQSASFAIGPETRRYLRLEVRNEK
ncbi:MAG: tRNA lysidine(34) synthetase TilS [Bacteroidales bacterium]|nr:tRNA lysidine(34) synthetase TilS [Bacteroidales bacterium]